MLNQETIIKLAKQHGFKVGRDAGGEYVAPKYEDAVGSLVALVQAAYALGQEAQQAEPVAWEVSATKGDMPRQTKLEKSEAAALAQADHWQLVGCDVAVRGLVYAQADAAQPPAVAVTVPDGYALVPIEPTSNMLMAADRVIWADADILGNYCDLWYAMLTAAQKGGA